MKIRRRVAIQVSLGLALAVAGVVAEPTSAVIEVNARFAGTLISIEPGRPYDTATLSVVGPKGFEAKGRFAGGTLFLDLAAAGKQPEGRGGGSAAQTMFPDGHYRWEARLIGSDATESIATGSFTVEDRTAVERTRERSELANNGSDLLAAAGPLRSPSVGAHDIGGESLNVDDILWVVDDQNDKTTSVQLLLGNGTDGYDFRFWNMTNDDGLFRIDRSTNFIPPGLNRFSIAEDGNVGLSTTTAPKRLTIHTTTVNDGIRLINDAGAFETSWDIAVDAFAGITFRDAETDNGVMRLREGAPSESLVIAASGDVGMGTASPSAKLHVAGSGRIDGDVALGSSRTLKTGFGEVSPAEVLARVADLPLSSWRYKTEDEATRHIGPFAEDFHRLFGLGDGETISVIDAQGVTLAAIQGLQQELAEKDAQIAALNARLAALEARLSGGDVN